jgi:hypothetical protein
VSGRLAALIDGEPMPDTIGPVTAKEKVLEHLPNWTDEQAERALTAAESERGPIRVEDRRPPEQVRCSTEEWGEPEMVGLPEHLKTFEDGTPVPNWVAALDEVRSGR